VEAWADLADVALVLAAALAAAGIAEKLKLSPILGYLLAGGLLGPNGLGLVERGPVLLALAELGVTLLLFMIGLELPRGGLGGMGKRALAAGLLQVLLTVALAAAAGPLLGLPPHAALVLGLVLAPSSTAAVMRLLAEKTLLDSVAGRASLAILLVQDLALVPSVFLVEKLGRSVGAHQPAPLSFGGTLLWFAVGSLALFWFFRSAVGFMLPPLHGARQKELVLLLTVTCFFAAALGARAMGVSPALGALVAGVILAGSPYAPQVRADVGNLRTLFLAVFFVAIGTLTRLDVTLVYWAKLALGLLGVLLTKGILVTGLLFALGYPRGPALAAGLYLGQLGEFSFVLADLASRAGILEDAGYAHLIALTTASLMVTPGLIALGSKVARWPSAPPQGHRVKEEGHRGGTAEPLALVVGLGPAGQTVARTLQEVGWRVVAVDSNPEAQARGARLGILVFTGDARHTEVLHPAWAETVALAVITVPDPFAAKQIVEGLRSTHPSIPIIARGRYSAFVELLRRAGATRVVDEEAEVGDALARSCLELVDPHGS